MKPKANKTKRCHGFGLYDDEAEDNMVDDEHATESEHGEEPYRRLMNIGANSHATQGDNWDEDAAPICDGGGGLPPGGPIKYALPPTRMGERGLEWYGTPPEVGREGGGGRWG